jgi:DDE_Tnp_1-associated
MLSTFLSYFSSLEDPRIDYQKLHSLTDILFLTLCAVLSGYNDWDEIKVYGIDK